MVDALAGRGFIIVGGTAGIGLAAATALAAAGADVAVVGRDARRAQATATGLGRDYGVRAVAVPGDAGAGQDEVDRFVSEATEALGDVAGMAVTTGWATALKRHECARHRKRRGARNLLIPIGRARP